MPGASCGPEPRQTLLADLDRLLADGGFADLLYLQPEHIPPKPTNLIRQSRLHITLAGALEATACVGATPALHRFAAGTAVYAPPFGWADATWKVAHEVFGIVFHPGCTRFLHFHNPGLGQAVQAQVWIHTHDPARAALRHAVLAMDDLAHRRDAGPAARRQFVAVLALARDELVNDEADASPGRRQWRELCDWVNGACHLAIDRAAAAAEFGIHPNHVSRLFQRHGGESFVTFLTRARLALAAELLRTSRAPVAEVAQRCGFAGANYFGRLFRRAYGATPAEWRATPAAAGNGD